MYYMKISVECQLYVYLSGLEIRELGFILIMSNYCDSISVSTLFEPSKAYGMFQKHICTKSLCNTNMFGSKII